MTKDQWGAVKQNLLANVGQHNYKSWIEPLVLDRTEDGVAVIGAPNSYAGTYVSRNFGDLILGEVSSVNQQIRRLEFIVSQAANVNAAEPARPAQVEVEPAPAPEAAKPAKPSALDAMLQPAPLDPRFTFDSFVVGKPNELAHAAARRVAEGGPVTFNPLFLYGGVGLGKTHLMHAIANELQKNRPELTVVYLSAEQFMYRFVQAIRERRTMDFKSLFRTVDVLMVDDVQFIAGKDSTQEEFFHTFNALVDQNKQIIISGDRAPGEMTDMEERIRSRMQCGLIVDLHPTDYELRLGILQSKVDAQRSQYPDLKMADGVLEFLAHRTGPAGRSARRAGAIARRSGSPARSPVRTRRHRTAGGRGSAPLRDAEARPDRARTSPSGRSARLARSCCDRGGRGGRETARRCRGSGARSGGARRGGATPVRTARDR